MCGSQVCSGGGSQARGDLEWGAVGVFLGGGGVGMKLLGMEGEGGGEVGPGARGRAAEVISQYRLDSTGPMLEISGNVPVSDTG